MLRYALQYQLASTTTLFHLELAMVNITAEQVDQVKA